MSLQHWFKILKCFLQSNSECLYFHIYLFIYDIMCIIHNVMWSVDTVKRFNMCLQLCLPHYHLHLSSCACMVSSMLWLCLVCLLCLDSFQCGSWKTSSSSLCAFNIQVVKKDQTKKLILQCSPELAWYHELHTAVLSSHHLFPAHNNMLKSYVL